MDKNGCVSGMAALSVAKCVHHRETSSPSEGEILSPASRDAIDADFSLASRAFVFCIVKWAQVLLQHKSQILSGGYETKRRVFIQTDGTFLNSLKLQDLEK